MSDTKLRDLERRWKETGTAADEAAYLLERVRVGDLTEERLRVAASCGHEAARVAVAAVGLANLVDVVDLEVHGREVVERGCVATVRLLLPCWHEVFPTDVRLSSAVDRAERMILGLDQR